ncbi:MAG: hypothetical protein OJF49_001275 [Ktedonobacterales bacterium]|nr:MAG: hypothetical protein OJF49_001275 [Ktedonobacterales bacterium]
MQARQQARKLTWAIGNSVRLRPRPESMPPRPHDYRSG